MLHSRWSRVQALRAALSDCEQLINADIHVSTALRPLQAFAHRDRDRVRHGLAGQSGELICEPAGLLVLDVEAHRSSLVQNVPSILPADDPWLRRRQVEQRMARPSTASAGIRTTCAVHKSSILAPTCSLACAVTRQAVIPARSAPWPGPCPSPFRGGSPRSASSSRPALPANRSGRGRPAGHRR